MLKKNAMEYAIQKTTEIGVSDIVMVISERTVASPDHKGQKIKRWQKISDEASKQSKRDFKCPVRESVVIEDIDIGSFDRFFVPYENASPDDRQAGILEDLSGMDKIAYLIGPEGGFSKGEVELLVKNNARPIRLGDSILRAETAAVYFLSVLDFYFRTNR